MRRHNQLDCGKADGLGAPQLEGVAQEVVGAIFKIMAAAASGRNFYQRQFKSQLSPVDQV